MEAACLVQNVSNAHSPAKLLETTSSFMGSHRMEILRLNLKGIPSEKRWVLSTRAGGNSKKLAPYANYAVPLDNQPASSCITRPLVEILRDLNKRVPDKVIKLREEGGLEVKYIPWFHANRMLSFYAPGWCGEIRSVNFSDDGRFVSVVYRVTIRGSDGEAYRESSGTISLDDDQIDDPVQKAEAIAFPRACARFGLGLYLHHEGEAQ